MLLGVLLLAGCGGPAGFWTSPAGGYRQVALDLRPDGSFESQDIWNGPTTKPMPPVYQRGTWTTSFGKLNLHTSEYLCPQFPTNSPPPDESYDFTAFKVAWRDVGLSRSNATPVKIDWVALEKEDARRRTPPENAHVYRKLPPNLARLGKTY